MVTQANYSARPAAEGAARWQRKKLGRRSGINLESQMQNKKPTAAGWLFILQINDLLEFDVEQAMGIEHVGPGSLNLQKLPLIN